jgi:hypothetical protein
MERDYSARTDEVAIRGDEDSALLQLSVNGETFEVQHVACPFPLSSPGHIAVFYGPDGEEICLVEDIDALDDRSGKLLKEALEESYFMPHISEVHSVEKTGGVHRWAVTTNRGKREFDVRSVRRNIRQLEGHRLVIKDVDGNRYQIANWHHLDADSIQCLRRYL